MINSLKIMTIFCALLISKNAFCEKLSLDKERKIIAVKIELSKLRAADQGIRHELERLQSNGYTMKQILASSVGKFWGEIDRENCAKLKEILKKTGWPTLSVYGEEADTAAWIIAQHAYFDPPFQKQALQILEEKLKTKDTIARNYAYLLDRVNLDQKKLQVYGTQGHCLKKSFWIPWPMENPGAVDARRKRVGLEPMASYKKLVNGYCY